MKRVSEPFDTERLHFRLLEAGDLNNILRQFSDPEMCRYLSDPPVDREGAEDIIQFFQSPEEDGYLRYGLFHRNSGEFIGTCGYHHWDSELRQVELGYDIWRDYWRQGYASEALEPLIRICFERLAVDQVYVLIDPENTGSIATALRFGFVVSEPCRPLDEPRQLCMKLTRAAWQRGDR